jgi:hypothetical protein
MSNHAMVLTHAAGSRLAQRIGRSLTIIETTPPIGHRADRLYGIYQHAQKPLCPLSVIETNTSMIQ